VAVKIRLMRMGKTKQPTYRLVAADSRSPRDGRFIEILGVYAPRGRSTADPDAVVEIDNDKVLKWLRQGALPTDRVERLLRRSGAWDQFRSGVPAGSAPATVTVAASSRVAPAAGATEVAAAASETAAPEVPASAETEEAGSE
jgi:small subunit ribosomal protein S16